MDLSDAFYKINYKLLMAMLEVYDFNKNALSWSTIIWNTENKE